MITETPRFRAEIQTGDSAAGPFETESPARRVSTRTRFDVDRAPARYLVVWITDLGGAPVAHVNEVRASR